MKIDYRVMIQRKPTNPFNYDCETCTVGNKASLNVLIGGLSRLICAGCDEAIRNGSGGGGANLNTSHGTTSQGSFERTSREYTGAPEP